MAKQVHILTMHTDEGHSEVLGAYSEKEFAQVQAQIYERSHEGSDMTDLHWMGNCATVDEVQYVVSSVTLDEDVRL